MTRQGCHLGTVGRLFAVCETRQNFLNRLLSAMLPNDVDQVSLAFGAIVTTANGGQFDGPRLGREVEVDRAGSRPKGQPSTSLADLRGDHAVPVGGRCRNGGVGIPFARCVVAEVSEPHRKVVKATRSDSCRISFKTQAR